MIKLNTEPLTREAFAPFGDVSDFLVVDRGGEGNNLEEYFFDKPYVIDSN